MAGLRLRPRVGPPSDAEVEARAPCREFREHERDRRLCDEYEEYDEYEDTDRPLRPPRLRLRLRLRRACLPRPLLRLRLVRLVRLLRLLGLRLCLPRSLLRSLVA